MSSPTKRLSLQGQLFARSREVELIRSCLHNQDDSVQIVLVHGSSGVGKSTLLHHAANHGEQQDGFLLGSAKFDSLMPSPLEAIQDCLKEIVGKITYQANLTEFCRQRLDESMEHEHRELLSSVIPETCALLTSLEHEAQEEKKQEDYLTSTVNSKESMLQLQFALKAFVRAISKTHKVVLLMDDLHWCGPDTFDILLSLFADPKASNIVLCGSYRDNEVTNELTAFTEKLADALPTFHTLPLQSFDVESVNDMLVSLLNVDSNEATNELAKLIHQRTDGNIFFVQQFLDELQREELLKYNFMTTKWDNDVQRIQDQTALCENILQIVAQRIHRLEPPVQALLKLCACFGVRSHVSTLDLCQSIFDIENLDELLQVACQREHRLLVDLGSGWYKFSHDKILESAKATLLPAEKSHEREELHWKIGMLLYRALKNESSDSSNEHRRRRFLCADQINVGAVRLVSSDTERVSIAKLNLGAAKSASRLSAFRPACRYCQAGINVLLVGTGKRGDKAASEPVLLELYVHYAEMLFCVGQMAQARDYCKRVFASGSLNDKVQCYLIMMQILLSEAKNQEVLDFGLAALKALGEEVPKKPNKLQAHIEYKKTIKLLSGSTTEDILNLPLVEDSRIAACIQIMLFMVFPVVHLAMGNLYTVLVGRMLRHTFQYGLTTAAPEAFAVAGVDVIAQRDDLKTGYQLGKLAALVADRLKATSVKAKVYFWTSVFTQWWKEPLSQCLESCLKGYAAGMAVGDQHYAFHCITCYGLAYVYSGLPLLPLLNDMEKYGTQMIDYGQFMVLFCVIPMWQFVLNLCGKSDTPLDMTKGYAVEKQELAGNEKRIGEQACWSFLMQLCYYLDDMEKANDLSQRLQGLEIGLTRAEVFYPTRVFFFSLIAIEQYRRTGKRKYKNQAKKHMDQITKWIQLGAINLVHKGMILQAEMDALEMKDPEAVRAKYDKAFAFAMRSGFLQDAALASQLTASFCEKKLPDYMDQYVVKSWEQWMAWDAITVVQHLETKYSDILGDRLAGSAGRAMSSFRSRKRFDESAAKQHEQLDCQ